MRENDCTQDHPEIELCAKTVVNTWLLCGCAVAPPRARDGSAMAGVFPPSAPRGPFYHYFGTLLIF
eukprot:11202460-Lingulodinium_polyedra.AAC.1